MGGLLPRETRQLTFQNIAETADLQRKIALDVERLSALDATIARALVAQLALIVGHENGHVAAPRSNARDHSETFDQVVKVFRENGNSPLTKIALAAAAGVSKGSLHTLLYSTRKSLFDLRRPKGEREVRVKLKPDAIQAVGPGSP